MLLLLLSCAKPVETVDTDVEVTCGGPTALSADGDTWEGGVVHLTATGQADGAALTFDVPSGSFTATADGGDWTVGAHDPHLAEEVEVVVTTTKDGCEPIEDILPVTLDFPDRLRTVVVYNPSVPGSEAVASYYASFRDVPALCPIASADATTVSDADFPAWIAALQACIDAVGEEVHYVVPVWGVPYKVEGRINDIAGTGVKATVSLDAMMVYGSASASARAAVWSPIAPHGSSVERDFADHTAFGVLRSELDDPYYLVARIDGASAEAAMALVDRTAAAEALVASTGLSGIVYVDGNRGDTPPAIEDNPDRAGSQWASYEGGEINMWGTRWVFEDLGVYPVVWDGHSEELGTAPAPTDCPDALYYAGWYSYYNYNDCFTWAPGAIGGHLDSCSACDIRNPGTWAGSALIDGITATFGAVNEPYVAGMPEYDQLFLYLTQGATYGEAAYESTYIGMWMMVFVGDPLYRPFGGD